MIHATYQRRIALLAGALPVVTGCMMEPGGEGAAPSELAEAASLPPADPCSAPFSHDPERTLAIPLVMSKWVSASSRLPVDTGWYTNVVIQNTSPSLATVRLRAVSTAGAEYCALFPLGAETAVLFRADNLQAAGAIRIPGFPVGDFEGSMLIETDQRLAAMVRLSNTPLGSLGKSNGTAIADYQGLSIQNGSAGAGRELAFPYLKSGFNGKSTTLIVQNVEAWGDQIHVEVRTNDSAAVPRLYTYSVHVPGRRSVAIYPWQLTRAPVPPEVERQPMPSGCTGGANTGEGGRACFGAVRIVSGDLHARLAAIAAEHPASGEAAAIQAAHFESVDAALPRQWLPVVKHGEQGATTGMGIMNTSTSFQDVTVLLRRRAAPSSTYSDTFEDVTAHRSVVSTASSLGFPAGERGIAELISTGPIAAVGNEANSDGAASMYRGQGVPGDLAAPLIKVAWSGRSTKTTLLNVGDQAVQISGRYSCRTASGSTYSNHTHTMTAAAGAAVDFEPTNIPAGNLCSAMFTTAQRTLVGIVSEASIVAAAPEEGSIYEAIVLD